MTINNIRKNEKVFKDIGIESFWHITHLENLSRILIRGILSRKECENLGIDFFDLSNYEVQHRRRKYHDHVPLFFADDTPMLYVLIKKEKIAETILLELDKSLVNDYEGIIYADGNIACNETKEYNYIESLNDFDWHIIYRKGPTLSREWIRIRSAETLVPKRISQKYIKGIHVQTPTEYYKVLNIISKTKYKTDVKISLSEKGI